MSSYIPITDRAFGFAVRIIKLCNFLDQQPGTPRLLANQLFRSGTSNRCTEVKIHAFKSQK
ncbi:hypothetical protein [Okeania sp. SIO2C2]|uniref:hypothetical protein n=1 Tax=Okeania sp. SIO2C2 TaxID=2607787 RepID=UPI00257EEBE0|nr:hypothetical protein [Okeania sp. SIO2C2]